MEMDSDQRSRSASYYGILGVDKNSSINEIRSAYRKLAMQWHPDKWTRNLSVLEEAKRKFQQIQEAYSVLSDRRKRTMYDAGLHDPYNDEDEEEEGFVDFLQEMVSLMADVEREEKDYSMEELQQMFEEMAQGYDSCSTSTWYGGPPSFFQVKEEKDSSCRQLKKRARMDSKSTVEKDSSVNASGLETFGRTSFAN
ncbi:chaperone protein dnaJ 6-like [Telopea speciosissima]|uniref:chaperone protein dnaJ 6-like n=1 Tax=Telopea speciosissima TaxID=54955 RepID=UPI001CC3F32A|nr:chaperone protein dnaJ 6-like [Telopea speciosissima]